jgi:hypothetical protein
MGINSKPVFALKKILIVGLLPRQFETVRRRIGGRAELTAHLLAGRHRARGALTAGGHYHAVVDGKFISHSHLRAIPRDRCHLCYGGDTTVTRAVEELLV